MPSSTKVTSTSKLSTTSIAKSTRTNKAMTDLSDRETSMENMGYQIKRTRKRKRKKKYK